MSEWVATVGYVRSLKIGALAVWCVGRREGGYTCNHYAEIDLAPNPEDMASARFRQSSDHLLPKAGAGGASHT